MALAGHNKGKKWVPGIGYRYPLEPPVPERFCDTCGKSKSQAKRFYFYADGRKLCDKCEAALLAVEPQAEE
jgi:hypothetical protein